MLDKAKKDYLTGFYLREPFVPYLRDLVVQTKLKRGEFSMLILDIDHFKKYNDKYGHQFGDEVLKYVAGSIRLSLFDVPNTVFRYGGDEFVIVLPENTPKETAQIAYRLKYNMKHRPFLFNNVFHKITLSVGIAGYPKDTENIDDLLKKSDEAMYYSKKNGRDQCTLYNKLGYLKMRKLITNAVAIALVLIILFFSYSLFFQEKLQNTWGNIKDLRVTSSSAQPDKILLTNGNTLSGKIINESPASVTIEFTTPSGGSGSITVQRYEIVSITRGSK